MAISTTDSTGLGLVFCGIPSFQVSTIYYDFIYLFLTIDTINLSSMYSWFQVGDFPIILSKRETDIFLFVPAMDCASMW